MSSFTNGFASTDGAYAFLLRGENSMYGPGYSQQGDDSLESSVVRFSLTEFTDVTDTECSHMDLVGATGTNAGTVLTVCVCVLTVVLIALSTRLL